jgi:tetratricopeptide (TPR) repeat protein
VLSPTSSIVPVVDLLMEHRLYLAAWGPFLAAAVAAERLASRGPTRARRAAAVAGVALVASLGVLTHRRNAVWESAIALWSDAAAKSPGKARPHLGLGNAYLARGMGDAALARYRAAMAVGDPAFQAEVASKLGGTLVYLGRFDEAKALLSEQLARSPGDPDLRVYLALALMDRGDLAGAERLAEGALRSAPGHGLALQALGIIRLARGDAEAAAGLLERAVRDDPDDGTRRYQLGVAYATLGRRSAACLSWRAASGRLLGPRVRRSVEDALSGCDAR